tara:strand:+ start:306 stop:584 length:279 start_codon:yes stop_codon:yes gene_type:complete
MSRTQPTDTGLDDWPAVSDELVARLEAFFEPLWTPGPDVTESALHARYGQMDLVKILKTVNEYQKNPELYDVPDPGSSGSSQASASGPAPEG